MISSDNHNRITPPTTLHLHLNVLVVQPPSIVSEPPRCPPRPIWVHIVWAAVVMVQGLCATPHPAEPPGQCTVPPVHIAWVPLL